MSKHVSRIVTIAVSLVIFAGTVLSILLTVVLAGKLLRGGW